MRSLVLQQRRNVLLVAVLALAVTLALPTAALAQGPGRGMGPGMGPGMGGLGPGMGMGGLAGYGPVVLGAVAETLGMTPAELSAQLQGGVTLAELAQARNVTPDQVVTNAVDAVSQLLDQQMPQGQLSQAQRQMLLAQLESQVRAQLSTPGFPAGLGMGLGLGFADAFQSPMLIQTARVLNLSATDLLSRLQAGASVADLVEEQGGDLELDIIEPLLAPERARLQVMVNMDFITQAQADAELALARGQLFCQAYMPGGAFGYGMGLGRGMGGMMRGWLGGMMGCPYCW